MGRGHSPLLRPHIPSLRGLRPLNPRGLRPIDQDYLLLRLFLGPAWHNICQSGLAVLVIVSKRRQQILEHTGM